MEILRNFSGARWRSTLLNEQRYLPFGETRPISGSVQTDYGYRAASRRDTGQRALDQQGAAYTLGLMDYRARFYSVSLGRFHPGRYRHPARPAGVESLCVREQCADQF